MTTSFALHSKRALCTAAILVASTLTLTACGDEAKEKKPGQALVSVNGEEVTMLQLNEELQRAGVNAAQQEVASKQLLQMLIDRQLLEEAAARENVDRDPKVMQAVDRARSLIVAQAYLQKRIGNPARPTQAEVEEYFNKHPEFFANRKQFGMNQLVVAATDLTQELRSAADSAKSLEEVAVWLDAHKIGYGRTQITRSTADLPAQMSSRLLRMPKGQLFVVKEGPRAMFIAVNDVKDAPVSLQVASGQIEQYLMNQKNKEFAANEVQRLRASAKIEYLNKSMMPDAKPGAAPAATGTPDALAEAPVPAQAASNTAGDAGAGSSPDTDKSALDRGVAGLK